MLGSDRISVEESDNIRYTDAYMRAIVDELEDVDATVAIFDFRDNLLSKVEHFGKLHLGDASFFPMPDDEGYDTSVSLVVNTSHCMMLIEKHRLK